MPAICVAHLVRRHNGLAPFRRYLDSYCRHPAGTNHDHVIIFKGFESAQLHKYYKALGGLPIKAVSVDDTGYDIGSYLKAAEQTRYDAYCFLNSYSRILSDNWLRHLCAALTPAGVGMVGATGSWGSNVSYAQWQAGVPNLYDGYLIPVTPTVERIDVIRKVWRMILRWYRRVKKRLAPGPPNWTPALLEVMAKEYRPFPSPHLRTNAFLVRRDVLTSLPPVEIRSKEDAYRFESGRGSLTDRVLDMGLDVRVVGRDGRSFGRDDWPASNTFWQRDQGNLLVADNQTDRYADGTDLFRLFAARFAWREHAAPTLRSPGRLAARLPPGVRLP